MGIKLTNNTLFLRDSNGELRPVGMFGSGADKTLSEIAEYAESVKSDTTSAIDSTKEEAITAMDQKKQEVLDSIQVDHTELTNKVDGISERLDTHETSNESHKDIRDSVNSLSFEIASIQNTVTAGKIIDTMTGVVAHTDVAADDKIVSLVLEGNSTQDGTPSPDNPVPIVSPGDGGSLDVVVCGKNIFGGIQLAQRIKEVNPKAELLTDRETIRYMYNDINGLTIFDNFRLNTRYTIFCNGSNSLGNNNANLAVEYTDGTVKSVGFNSLPFVSVSGKSIKRLKGSWESGRSELQYNNFGIFEGVVTAEQFEPYKSQTATITTGLPLRGIGDMRDELRVFADGSGEIVKRLLQRSFKFSDRLSLTNMGNNARMAFSCPKGILGAAICTHTSVYNQSYSGDITHFYVNNSGILYLFLPIGSFNDDDNFSIVYEIPQELVKLTALEVQSILALHTYKPATNITADGATVTAEYVADPKLYIDSKLNDLFAAMSGQAAMEVM